MSVRVEKVNIRWDGVADAADGYDIVIHYDNGSTRTVQAGPDRRTTTVDVRTAVKIDVIDRPDRDSVQTLQLEQGDVT